MLHFGNIMVPAYGVAVALALMCGILLAMRCAMRLHLDTHAMWNLLLLGVVAELAGARLEYFVFHFRDVLLVPRVLLNGRGISWGGLLLAVLSVLVYARYLKKGRIHLPLLRTLDALAAPLLLSIAVMEGAAAMDLWGVWDAPVYFCAVHLLSCVGIVVWMERTDSFPLKPGELFGAVMFLFSLTLFCLLLVAMHLFLVSDPTPLLWLAAFLAVIGGALWFDWGAPGGKEIVMKDRLAEKENHAL
jgi:hypothetical protein